MRHLGDYFLPEEERTAAEGAMVKMRSCLAAARSDKWLETIALVAVKVQAALEVVQAKLVTDDVHLSEKKVIHHLQEKTLGAVVTSKKVLGCIGVVTTPGVVSP